MSRLCWLWFFAGDLADGQPREDGKNRSNNNGDDVMPFDIDAPCSVVTTAVSLVLRRQCLGSVPNDREHEYVPPIALLPAEVQP